MMISRTVPRARERSVYQCRFRVHFPHSYRRARRWGLGVLLSYVVVPPYLEPAMPVPVCRRLRANKALELTAVPASGNVANFHAFHAIVVGATVIGGSSARAFARLIQLVRTLLV